MSFLECAACGWRSKEHRTDAQAAADLERHWERHKREMLDVVVSGKPPAKPWLSTFPRGALA